MINILYAVDPGKARSSVASFLDGVFVGCWMVHVSDMQELAAEKRGRVVMELPVVYPGSRVRASDLVDLAAAGMAVASRLAAQGERIHTTSPSDWKGQVPKEVTRKRVLAKLTAPELSRLTECLAPIKPSLQHNLFDAIGIGLVFLKRARRGVI